MKTVLPVLVFFSDYYSFWKTKTFICRESVFIILGIKLLCLKDFVPLIIMLFYRERSLKIC